MRFIEWDWDAGFVIEYERDGECNGCGDCCRSDIHFLTAGTAGHTRREGGESVAPERLKVWNEVASGNERRFFGFWKVDAYPDPLKVKPCYLLVDNKCSVNDKKPLICSTFPSAPEQIADYKNCSYSFKETNRWEIATPCPVIPLTSN